MLSLFDIILAKRLRKRIKLMAKNIRKKGKSARRGNSQSPYQKYGKREHQYSPAYYAWKRGVMAGRGNAATPIRSDKGDNRRLQAAE